MPDTETTLLQLLRCELTTVNQQFSHILSLRARGLDDTATRIAEIDDVDFPNAMRIADYLIRQGAPIRLGGDHYTPGCGKTAVLLSEQEMERRMAAALDAVQCADATQERLVSDARAPRAAYAEWLKAELAKDADVGPRVQQPDHEIENLLAHLLALMEQTLIHALMHRHAGDPDSADGAWATSGAAMMHITYLIRFFSRENVTPPPGRYPPIRIADSVFFAPEQDQSMAGQCATAAMMAASAVENPQLATLCDNIADHCEDVSEWERGRQHPAIETNPPAFFSFDRTYATYVAMD